MGGRFGPGRVDEGVQVVVDRRSGLDDDHGDGLRVILDLTGRRPSVCVGHARHNAYPRRTVLPVIIRRDILAAALVRARLPGEWSCSPVVGGGWGWHAIKIQALQALRANRHAAPK